MSHRHGDHTGGMSYLLGVNPKVRIYAPKGGFGVYGADLPSTFYRKDESLPAEQRYCDGRPPDVMRFGSAWPQANITLIDKTCDGRRLPRAMEAQHDGLLLKVASVDIAKDGTNARIAADTNFSSWPIQASWASDPLRSLVQPMVEAATSRKPSSDDRSVGNVGSKNTRLRRVGQS